MKSILLSLTVSIFMILSLNAFAETPTTDTSITNTPTTNTPAANTSTITKMTISGEPVVVTQSGTDYVLPGTTTYTTKSDYYFIDVNGKKQVCYREVQSTFAGINPVDLSLKIGNDTVSVKCYDFSLNYFIVQ